jgi:hypothetical protein
MSEDSMAIEIRVVGLGIAKNVFQVHGVDRAGKEVLSRRSLLLHFLPQAQKPHICPHLSAGI